MIFHRFKGWSNLENGASLFAQVEKRLLWGLTKDKKAVFLYKKFTIQEAI